MNEPFLNMLGIARRAGKLSIGFEMTSQAIRDGKARLIVAASDLTLKTEKELRYLLDHGPSQKTGSPSEGGTAPKMVRVPYDMKCISHAIGTKAGVLSVDDDGLAGAVLKRCPSTEEDDAQ